MYENIFSTAMQTRNIEDYWQYLEALLPDNIKGENQVIELVSSITLLNVEAQYVKKKSVVAYLTRLICCSETQP